MAAPIVKRDYDEWLEFCKSVQTASTVSPAESERVKTARIKKAKSDYNYFVKTYFTTYADHDCAPFHIEFANACLADPDFMGVAEWPREHAKSVHIDIIIPMWLIAHGQLTGMILMGKNNTDACNLLSDVQAQLQFNELFANDFGEQYNFGSWEDGDFTTKDGIRFLAVGRNQSPRGARKGEKRPNYAAIDDIDDDEIVNNLKRVKRVVKNIFGALYFALSIKGARMCVGGNRIHFNSILANIVGDVKEGMKKRKGLYHSKVYAITDKKGIKPVFPNDLPEKFNEATINAKPAWSRYTLAQLIRKFNAAGSVLGSQEFFHKTEVEGDIFKNKYFKWEKLPHLGLMQVIIGYFDPSFENKVTSDTKAVRIWGLRKNKRFCIKSFVRRCELEEVFRWMVQVDKSLPAGVGIVWYVEKQFFNRPIKRALMRVIKETGHNLSIITDMRSKENKYTRIVKMEPEYSSGNVVYNEDEIHDTDMIEGNNQLKGIQAGYTSPDDAPDADEGAWHYLDQHLNFSEMTDDDVMMGADEPSNNRY
ncbi:C-terminal domain-containing protein [Maribacter dokdonensis]|uniref:phage terminase large subunit n=1 Tax=Maribacter dokdonensis TaxID=320912 RepID=UPI001B2748F3|nr:phage terminase large subunit [Maribacter dokdonensis]CAG2532937.1 C-terminal domain-containing protein [Maribacter dokdonensis]